MKTWLAGLALFAALTATADAETIAGTVVDAITKRPVAGAVVRMTFVSNARPLSTTTDGEGRFAVETSVIPNAILVDAVRFNPLFIGMSVIARNGLTGLVLPLYRTLLPLDRDFRPRNLCGAFQPGQLWDRYMIAPGGPCGTSKV